MQSLKIPLALLALALPLAGCTIEAQPAPVRAYYPAAVVVHPAPPPPRYEAVPPRPRGGYIWRPGHWEWTGNRYGWVPGRYVYRQTGWHSWVNGHWAPGPGGGIWVPGHWS